ncbi:MAG TPA: hypothetical protein VHD76_02475 [Bryobacteraceae bacterium]|jgi:hypothetical protein|nr:hypothetical protein [Bryobacteraceae bacterium]
MRKLICSFLFAALAVATAGAADLSGKWSGSFDITAPNGETHPDTAFMQLKEDHGQVTGTAGPSAEKQWAVRKGKLEGAKLTFEVTNEDGSILVFNLAFDGEEIQGDCSGTNDEGEKMSAKLHLKRVAD